MRNENRPSLVTQAHPRRTVLRAALGAGALSASSLLAPSDSTVAARRQTPEATPPADAAAEQVLRLQTGSSGDASFDFQVLFGAGDQGNWQTLLRLSPMYFDTDLNLQPAIFDSWESNDDMTVWTFTIDPRAVWSDGSPITAADVKGSWELMADPIVENPNIESYLGNVQGFEEVLALSATEAAGLVAADDRTLEVHLVAPDPLFHWRIATVQVAPAKIEQARADPQNFWLPENDPVSSGPYVLDAFDPDQGTATLLPNPNWWLDEGPYLERIEFRFVTDPETVSLMVQNGEVDAALQALPSDLQEEFPDFFRPTTSFGFHTFWLTTAEPTNDLNVRKALILSVDFDLLFQGAFPLGDGTFATQVLDPDLPCTETEQTWYTYDPEAAQAALAASSYGSAENLPRLRVTPRGSNPHQNRALEVIVEFWRQNLGITNVEFQPQPEGFGPAEDQINLTRDDVNLRFPDPASYMHQAAHSAGQRASQSMNGYANAEVDELVDQALQIAVDDAERCELSLEAQRVFMDDYQVLFFGIEERTLNARDYVRNYEKGPDRTLIEPWRLYLAEH